jgi:hypothetical protein
MRSNSELLSEIINKRAVQLHAMKAVGGEEL